MEDIKGLTQYRIIGEIAEGGMGTVYEATQFGVQGFEKKVAIKTLLSELYNDERFIDMFIDEAKLVANLVHENIVQIYQLGKADSGYYIVMEYVNGIPLNDLIYLLNQQRKLIPVELAVFIVSRIARGLAYAHSRADKDGNLLNIVHRDVCPNNILITTEGLPKLTDFGIAKARSNIMPANDQCLMGKLMYMSPEQAGKKETDPRGDIYSLGIVLLELLSGHKGREGKTKSETLKLAVQGSLDTTSLPRNLPQALLDILFKAIQVDPKNRYQTTEGMCTELEYYIYKDGYGPTIVTLENFLRKNFPELYIANKS